MEASCQGALFATFEKAGSEDDSHRLYQFGVYMPLLGEVMELDKRSLDGLLVSGPISHNFFEGVGCCYNPRMERYLLACKPVRVTAAIPVL